VLLILKLVVVLVMVEITMTVSFGMLLVMAAAERIQTSVRGEFLICLQDVEE
jgi:hypothetical protein